MMNRRNWIKCLAASTVASAVPAPRLRGAELRGSWTQEWIIKYSMSLIDWVREDLIQRAARLEAEAGQKHELAFSYFHGELERSAAAYHERFLAGRLSDKDTEAHIAAFLADLETVRAALAIKEAAAHAAWTAGEDLPKAVVEGKLFGQEVTARNLGVVLDASYSMTPYLEPLREEISSEFAESHIVEVDGCEIWDGDGGVPWFYASPIEGVSPFDPQRLCPAVPQTDAHRAWAAWTRDTLSALWAMVDLMRVDALYWFCDFDDEIEDGLFAAFGKEFTARGVKLYVHTLDERPPKAIQQLAEASGGAVIRKRVR